MGLQVVAGAMIKCSFGEAPVPLNVIPTGVMAGGLPAANVTAMEPLVNIPTFGMCNTVSNPAVAAATAAKAGVFTPAPCVPATVGPWVPGAVSVTIGGVPALTNECTCECAYGGVITVEDPGQEAVQAN